MKEELNWNIQAKCLLKSELVRRAISNDDLVGLLENIGVKETKASIDSKISRGTFSAAFLLKCLTAIGCRNFITEVETLQIAAEPRVFYKPLKSKTEKEIK